MMLKGKARVSIKNKFILKKTYSEIFSLLPPNIKLWNLEGKILKYVNYSKLSVLSSHLILSEAVLVFNLYQFMNKSAISLLASRWNNTFYVLILLQAHNIWPEFYCS